MRARLEFPEAIRQALTQACKETFYRKERTQITRKVSKVKEIKIPGQTKHPKK
jgi:hypothetical protein